ncbi:MAG TPA: EVE domain-containing protein, partial [Bacteroidia bacterium]|nr:EVE domain-containing protein [Bacteroidia bacterium]
DDARWVGVELTPYKALKKPVTLAQVKEDARLKDIALVRIGRLSVMPLKKEEFNVILELSK